MSPNLFSFRSTLKAAHLNVFDHCRSQQIQIRPFVGSVIQSGRHLAPWTQMLSMYWSNTQVQFQLLFWSHNFSFNFLLDQHLSLKQGVLKYLSTLWSYILLMYAKIQKKRCTDIFQWCLSVQWLCFKMVLLVGACCNRSEWRRAAQYIHSIREQVSVTFTWDFQICVCVFI